MRPLTTAIALMLCAALLFVPSSDAEAQDGDSVSITTKMILTALDSLDGSGQVQYRFEGAAALQDLVRRQLRQAGTVATLADRVSINLEGPLSRLRTRFTSVPKVSLSLAAIRSWRLK